jgi:Protein of unknown function (DUF3800)
VGESEPEIMAPKRLVIFIDDSGQKEYGDNTSRYFVYAGVVVDRAEEQSISDEVDELKRGCFGTSDVEIKSNWVRMPLERKRRYLDPFGITENVLDGLVAQLYALMASDRLTYVAAAIDKPQMRAQYGNPYYPSALAYLYVLQRYQKHCAFRDAEGYVTIDDMSGSSPKYNQWRDLLRAQHERLKKGGCPFTKMRFDRVAPHPRFASSAQFNLLQIADLVAYNVYRQFRDYGETWDRPDAKSLPVYPPLHALFPRFMLDHENAITGWGIVKWPRKSPQRWLGRSVT